VLNPISSQCAQHFRGRISTWKGGLKMGADFLSEPYGTPYREYSASNRVRLLPQ
jgi:hypothetical protein